MVMLGIAAAEVQMRVRILKKRKREEDGCRLGRLYEGLDTW